MSQVLITQSKLDELALQVSGKSGEDMPLTVDEMTEAVAGITPVNNQTATVTPSTSQQVVTPDSDHTGLSQVTVEAAPLETKSVTKSSSGTTTYRPSPPNYGMSSCSVTVPAMTLPTTTSTTGTGINKATIGRSTSTRYINIPTGYNSAAARYTISGVADGTAGTPTASKSVSGSTATVTPSVTNTTGYITGGTKTGTAVTVAASELVSGTKSITANGTGIDVTEYASVDVAVPGGAPNLQAKTGIAPSTSSQTVTADTGYDGLSSVQIDAMPSGVVVPATAISSSGGATITTETGKIVLTKTVNNVPQVTTAGYVTSGTLGDTSVTLRATANIQGAQTITPGTSDQTIAAGTWLTGTQTISGDANLVAGNIKSGTSIFGVTGTYSGGGSVQFDTKTASGGSTYPVSLQFTSMKGEPKAFVCRLNAQVSSSGSTTYYYIVDVAAFGTTTHGNCFRIGSTRRVDNITSGYSWSYSGTTLTITSSAASRSASPGAFHSGSYELLYCY